jgi:excisionase family DNA binding protein
MVAKETNIVEELICIDDLCRILKLKKSYVYLLTHEKKIPHYKLGRHLRFKLSDIEKWLMEQFVDEQETIKLVDY